MFSTPHYIYFENFLPDYIFQEISSIIEKDNFDWYWRKGATIDDEEYNFFHHLYYTNGEQEYKGPYYNLFETIFTNILSKFEGNKLIRAKLTLHVARPERKYTAMHYDVTDKVGGTGGSPNVNIIIYNFTTCNGGTKIEDTEISSQKNSAIMFSNTKKHAGIIQTDVPRRILLNMVFE